MKQLLFSAVLFLFSFSVFAQVTPVTEYRVATAGTTFNVNIPVGTKIFNIATGDYYVCTTAAPSTASITAPGTGAFVKLNPAEQSLSRTAAGEVTLSNDATGGSTSKFTITGDQVAVSNGAGTNEIVIKAEQTLGYVQGTDATFTTNTINLENGGTAVLQPASTTYAGLMTKAMYDRLFGLDTSGIGTFTVDSFEQVAVPTTFTLTATPKTGASLLVSLNGQELKLTTEYTIAGTTLTIVIPTTQYDKVTVSYMK